MKPRRWLSASATQQLSWIGVISACVAAVMTVLLKHCAPVGEPPIPGEAGILSPIPTNITAGTVTVQNTLIAEAGFILGQNSVTPVGNGALQRTADGGFIWAIAAPAYGDGSDGAAVFDGVSTPAGTTLNSSTSYTVNRDVYYTSITGSQGVVVSDNGYRVFDTGTLAGPGIGSFTFDNSGNPGAAGTGSGAAAGGAACAIGSLGGTASGAGGAAGSNAASVTTTFGGSGGNGGGASGGTGGTSSAINNSRPRSVPEAMFAAVLNQANTAGSFRYGQGASGGGGGTNAANSGGGGGSGGCPVVVAAPIVTGHVNFRSNGGGGGNAISTDGPGGGGGAGTVILITNDLTTWTGSELVTGGPAGTGGSGAAATPGSNGFATIIPG